MSLPRLQRDICSASHHCTRCDDNIDVTEIPPLEHYYVAWYVVKPSTCSENGEKRRHCDRCGYYEVEYLSLIEHDYVKHETKLPTCTENGWNSYVTCSNCDYSTYVEVPSRGGHEFGEWIEIVAPGSGIVGKERRDCINCDCYEVRDSAASGYLQSFIDAVAELSENQSAEATYEELYSALQIYASLTDEEKEEASESFAVLQSAIEEYNAKAALANNESAVATEIAFASISACFTYLAALWLLLKKKLGIW